MSRFERRYRNDFGLILILAVIFLWLYAANVLWWDWLIISSALTTLVSLRWAILFPGRTNHMLEQLHVRGLLYLTNQAEQKVSDEQLGGIKSLVEERSGSWANIGGLIGFVVFVFITGIAAIHQGVFTTDGWSWSFFTHPDHNAIYFVGLRFYILVELAVGYVIGYYLGFAASTGRLQRLFKEQHILIKADPHSFDKTAGLKPLGAFYFFQAIILAVPALFLALWWYLMGGWTFAETNYAQDWQTPYFALLVLVLMGELLAFAVPMWLIHQEMLEQKRHYQEEAEKRVREASLSEAEYQRVQNMPTWPVETGRRGTYIFALLAQLLVAILAAVALKYLHL